MLKQESLCESLSQTSLQRSKLELSEERDLPKVTQQIDDCLFFGLLIQSLVLFFHSYGCLLPTLSKSCLKYLPTLSQKPSVFFFFYTIFIPCKNSQIWNPSRFFYLSDIYFSASHQKFLIWVLFPQDLIRWPHNPGPQYHSYLSRVQMMICTISSLGRHPGF